MSKKSFKMNKENNKGGAPVPPPFPGKESVQPAAAPELPAFNKDEEIRKASEAAHSVPKNAVQNEDEELSLFTGSLKKVTDEPEVFKTAAAPAADVPEKPAETPKPEATKKQEPEGIKAAETAPVKEETPAAEPKPEPVSANAAKEAKADEPKDQKTPELKTPDTKAEAASDKEKSVSPAVYPIKIPPVPTTEKTEEPKKENILSKASIKPARVRRITKQKNPAAAPKAPRPKYRAGKILVGLFLFALICGFAGGFGAFMWFEKMIANVPPLDVGKREEYSQASKLYDASGNFLAEYGTNENVVWADSEEIPQQLKDAFIAIEDERFYTHNGIDLKRLIGAVIGQITGNAHYGASTITQQLIKNTHLTQEVTYERKAMEIHLALELEKVMSKDDILTWYMNTLFLGDSNYGIKVAAEDYFGKTLNELSLKECAILAGLAQSPNQYNPRLNKLKGDMTPSNTRANNVLYKMYETGKITESQYQNAINEPLTVLDNSRRYELYNYPIYVEYAVENVASKLLEAEETEITDETLYEKKQWLRTAGYIIYTAFDKNIQDIAQDAITNFSRYPATVTGTQVEASAVIMDQHTGEVVAMVGGREEPTEPEGFNRATDSTQAVGSSIKPLSVYAPACETGDYPGTTVMDTQESIQGYGADNSYPNGDHTGSAITMRRALELSHNIPAARFLLEHVGIDRAYDFMVKEGFAPENLAKTPAGLALGATDVTTLEMTGAYACLANGGEYIEPHAYKRVTDRFGNEIMNTDGAERHRVFSQSTAWLVTDMMQSNMTDGYGVNARLKNVASAGKTGTHEHQVISFGGYSPYYTSFLRISADDYVRMINSSSYYQSAGLWHAYMQPIHDGLEDKPILDYTAEDVGIQKYWVCTNSGQLAQSWCSGHWEYAAPNNAPTVYCEGHQYGSGDEEWNEWNEESTIDYNDPEWYLKGWWDEEGNFHPY
ncbi:MAG: transglycosylase domain-containing protein [Solobacterium sp.]|nr:transglycosylase domain-containing protein [Solobacterium sp.]